MTWEGIVQKQQKGSSQFKLRATEIHVCFFSFLHSNIKSNEHHYYQCDILKNGNIISWWWREQACKLCYFGALKIVNFPSDTGVGHMVYMQFSSFGDWVATLFSFVFGLYVHLLVYAVIVPTLPHPLVGREVVFVFFFLRLLRAGGRSF